MSNSSSNGHATKATRGPKAKPVPFANLEAARVVTQAEQLGQDPSKDDQARLGVDWSGAALHAVESGREGLEHWLRSIRDVRPNDAVRYAEALETARGEPTLIPHPAAAETKPYSLELLSTADFFGETYSLEWLAKGCMVKGEACVVGGPSKALKTSILIDLALSLASGTMFLERFEVPKRVRVGLISGESGRRVIQANAKQICLTRRIAYEDVGGIFWGFKLPQLTNTEHLAALRKSIEDHGIEVMCLDPLYLSLLAGSSGIDASNMYQMGPLLNDVAALCLDLDCTPTFCHHAIKRRENPFEPMELEDLAFSGIGQFARQWMLPSRREKYDAESGIHRLHFRYGGSAGHAGEIHLDIETGRIDDDFNGRLWNVTTALPSESMVEQKAKAEEARRRKFEEKEQEKAQTREDLEQKAMNQVLDVIAREPEKRATASTIRKATGMRKDLADRILYRIETAGLIVKADVPTDMGAGRPPKDYPGFQLVDLGGK